MKNNKYKILVLSDLKDSAEMTLKSTVSLAKMTNGEIYFFHAKVPTEIIKRENQLSAMRDINHTHLDTDRKIKSIIAPISEEYGINIDYKFSFGNVKQEIVNYINEIQPDIIVLGKRKPKLIKFIGDSITHFVLKNYQGVVMIAANKNALDPDKELSLGVLDGEEKTFNIAFAQDLMSRTRKPLKSFKILKNSNSSQEKSSVNDKNMIEYVFEQGDNAINNLSKYLSISKTNLLFVNRTVTNSKTTLMDSDIQKVMDSLNVTLLFTNGKANFNNSISSIEKI